MIFFSPNNISDASCPVTIQVKYTIDEENKGNFTKIDIEINQRPIWESPNGRMIWFNAVGSQWLISDREHFERNNLTSGYIKSVAEANCPNHAAGWRQWTGSEWTLYDVDIWTEVVCPDVVVVNNTHSKWYDGYYTKTDVLNGRPAYRASSNLSMIWSDHYGYWMLGSVSSFDNGYHTTGWLWYPAAHLLCPDEVDGFWQEWYNSTWNTDVDSPITVSAPGLK